MNPADRQTMYGDSSTSSGEQISVAHNEILQVRIPEDPVTYYTRVLSLSKGVLMLPWPTDGSVRLITRPGDILEFYFVRGGKLYNFSGAVEKTDTGPLPHITVIAKNQIQQIQRRQHYRARCLLPIEISWTSEQNLSGESRQVLIIKTVTTDLSAGGISFRHARQIPEGTQLNIKLSLPDNAPAISIPCKVIYSRYISEHQTLYRTAMRFVALNEGERSRIIRFIYRIQLQGLRP